MKIRTLLVLRFTIVVASILILFAFTVYYFSSSYREQELYSRLKEKAITVAKLYSKDVEEVSPYLLNVIEKNSLNLLPSEKIVIYDYRNRLIFHSPENDSTELSKELLNNIRLYKEVRYLQGEREVLGILFEGQYDRYVVVASAFDRYGLSKLKNLKYSLIIGVFGTICITVIAGFLFSKKALLPISEVVEQVDEITAHNLNKRLNEGNGKDEIAHLSITFNQMLNRIEKAFELQKNFVSNASHELRTPLTSITGHLEVALIKRRSPDEYETIIGSALEEIKSLNSLTNGLLELTQANIDASGIKLHEVRIDELLWQARNELQYRNPSYKINVEITDFPQDEDKLTVLGSEHLLKIAILNIMDNACKFSKDNQVDITFSIKDGSISLFFIDKGIGISEDDMKKILQPFYRGGNAKKISGHGIGLSLSQKIIELHKGILKIESVINQFTKVSIQLPLSS